MILIGGVEFAWLLKVISELTPAYGLLGPERDDVLQPAMYLIGVMSLLAGMIVFALSAIAAIVAAVTRAPKRCWIVLVANLLLFIIAMTIVDHADWIG